LAAEGYKLCVVYRESRARDSEVRAAMTELDAMAPVLLHFNADALSEAGRRTVLDALEQTLRPGERVSVLLHSLAKGALKPLCSEDPPPKQWPANAPEQATSVLARGDLPKSELTSRDVALTVEAMGTSLLDWVNELRARRLFAPDTRVLAFTSEGSQRVWRGYGAVSAAKATLESLIRSMAFELGPFGIRANCIQAGVTDTRALQLVPDSEALKLHAIARNPLGRLTTPEDIANAVSLLCKPEAAWINGTTLVVDGGEHLC
jgi:enoyl-[acyl-carrier protein] reductase I